jgi:hypothetical protein
VQQHLALVLHVAAGGGDHTVEAWLHDLVPQLGQGPAGAEEHQVPVRTGPDHGLARSRRDEPAIVDERAVDVEEHRLATHNRLLPAARTALSRGAWRTGRLGTSM